MKKRLPPLNWLRTFELSAQHLNFTQAAHELNLTQAAISQQIKGLESQLGVSLFKRLPRGLELTEAGRAYIPVVHEAIERLVVATDELFGQNRNRDLNIRVSLVFFNSWLAPRLGEFRQLHPEVGLRISSNIWTDQTPVDADLEIRHGLGKWSGFSCDRLSWDQLIPVCSPTYMDMALKGHSGELTPKLLSNCTLLHVLGYNEGWGHWLNKNGYPELKPAQSMQLDSLLPALELAVQNQGVALGRTCLVQAQLDSQQLIAPFSQSLSTDEAFYLAVPDNQHQHADAQTFRTWLIAEAKKHPEAG